MIPLRAFIADGHPVMLGALTRLLSSLTFVQVVGTTCSGRTVLEAVEALQPDVVLLDWSLPKLSGIDVTQRLKAQAKPPRAVLMALHDRPEYEAAARAAGADAFVGKCVADTELLPLLDAWRRRG
ncbi:MAG: response regulator transcription factor [Chloroflexi bacterium]|nr:response regulator transcription factor [Chloroflexota bacterium]